MFINFATCERGRALSFLRAVLNSGVVEDTDGSAGTFLDFVEADVVRVQDPMMYGSRIQIIPGNNWDESKRDAVTASLLLFANEDGSPKVKKA